MVGLTAPSGGTATISGTPFPDLDDPVHMVGSIVDGVEYHPGRRAIEGLEALAVLRYSATHSKHDNANLVYRLDAIAA
jgi:restriction endonuclease